VGFGGLDHLRICLSQLTGPRLAIAISTVVWLASGAAARALAGRPRTQVRTMAATVMAGHHDPVSDAARDKLRNLAETLFEADESRALGRITATEHETIWWRVYDQMDSGHFFTRGKNRSNRRA
jgi:hypothetical protein